ncbi:MAG TPA: 3-hydroxybutyryl-CoA dehydrogenase [Stellaceae bacterium]|jgi:3-hydroxybutyryl-CoA dehydrogenase|nr:3-hydroxybutyryl-CoA dehydrogenase [Stellaceae bacterium]
MSRSLPLIAIAGAGRMGRGLAHAFAYTGHQVRLIDLKPRAPGSSPLDAAREEIAATIGLMRCIGTIDDAQLAAILARISYHNADAADAALAEVDIIFEGVPEIMAVKATAFARIGAAARPDALIASTTSTFAVDELAAFIPGPARFLNAHWLNPAYLVPLVEVSPSAATAPATLELVMAALRRAGKVPVKCAAAPGFIVPRIQALAMNEAARIVAAGVATAEDVDTATRVGLGLRFAIIGLVEFIDWGGGDILYYASNYLKDALGDGRHAPPEIITRNMQEGATGMRAGRGFHDWSGRDLDSYRNETLTRLVGLLQHLALMPKPE